MRPRRRPRSLWPTVLKPRPARRKTTLITAAAVAAAIVLAGMYRFGGALFPRANLAAAQATPVGLVASPLVVAVDRRGNVLPIDPADPVLDLPVLRVTSPRADAFWGMRILARDVARMADVAPEVFAVISEARLGEGEATLLLGDSGVRVRYRPPISEMRLREAIVVLNDAMARLEAPPREIDVRFAGQVVVRTR